LYVGAHSTQTGSCSTSGSAEATLWSTGARVAAGHWRSQQRKSTAIAAACRASGGGSRSCPSHPASTAG
jgi:hypothetical protein